MGGRCLGFWVVEERVGTPGPQHRTVDTEPALLGCQIGMGYARFVFWFASVGRRWFLRTF